MKTNRIFHNTPNFPWVAWMRYMGGFSILLVIGSFLYLGIHGMKYGIDFKGGVLVQTKLTTQATAKDIRDILGTLNEEVEVQSVGQPGSNEFQIRLQATDDEAKDNRVDKIKELLIAKFGANAFADGEVIRSVEKIGSKVGAEFRKQAFWAILWSLFFLLVYIAFRFDIRYSPGAVLCLGHDVVITLAFLAMAGVEMNLTVLAAILTLVGYSINDTIIVYDRIRENTKKYQNRLLGEIIDLSINETLNRTILTSSATLLVLAFLYYFGVGAIINFSLTLLFGIIVGTYSSVAVASPLTLVFNNIIKNYQEKRKVAV